MIETLGVIAAVALPLWNIPLMIRIRKRRSSKDVSVWWVWGVFGCLLLMLPSAIVSSDLVFKAFSFVNIVCFAGVVVCVVRYR